MLDRLGHIRVAGEELKLTGVLLGVGKITGQARAQSQGEEGSLE